MEIIDFYELSDYTTEARGVKDLIILHWSASDYDAVFSDYHINITGDGAIWIDGSLSDRRSHVAGRNTPSIGISLSCSAGASVTREGYVTRGMYPPKEIQLDTLAKVVAKLCIEIGIPLENVYTHSEIAELDGYGITSGDPDLRWDLIHQGEDIRERVLEYMHAWGF